MVFVMSLSQLGDGQSNRTKKERAIVPYPKFTTREVAKGQRGIFLVVPSWSGPVRTELTAPVSTRKLTDLPPSLVLS